MSAPPKRELTAWREGLQQELSQLESEFNLLASKKEALSRQIRLVDELLNASAGTVADFQSSVVGVMQEADAPLHLRDIRAALDSKGLAIPGQGSDANLISYLRRSADVIRISRGTYQFVTTKAPPVDEPSTSRALGSNGTPVAAKRKRRGRSPKKPIRGGIIR